MIACVVEMIQLETVRRLHFEHSLSLYRIDSLGVLEKKLRIGPASGLLWETTQR
jgi:hypothetical protein